MPSNSLPDADFNLPEMKTKSPSCPSGRVHMYAVVVQELEFAINRAIRSFVKLSYQYIVGSLSWRSLTHTEKFRAKWLQWPFTIDFSSS